MAAEPLADDPLDGRGTEWLSIPPPCEPGSRVGVIAPSGPVKPRLLSEGLRILREWGLVPVLYRSAQLVDVHDLDESAGSVGANDAPASPPAPRTPPPRSPSASSMGSSMPVFMMNASVTSIGFRSPSCCSTSGSASAHPAPLRRICGRQTEKAWVDATGSWRGRFAFGDSGVSGLVGIWATAGLMRTVGVDLRGVDAGARCFLCVIRGPRSA